MRYPLAICRSWQPESLITRFSHYKVHLIIMKTITKTSGKIVINISKNIMILFCSVPSVFKRIKDKQIERNDTYSKNVLFYPKVSGVQTFCNEKYSHMDAI